MSAASNRPASSGVASSPNDPGADGGSPTSSPPPPAPPPSPPPAPPTSPSSSSGPRNLAALLAAAALVVAVVVLVLLFGVAQPPQLATVGKVPAPSPEAGVAWSQWQEDGSCIHTVDPQGERTEVGCGYEGQELVAWTDEGIVVLVWGPRSAAEIIDPDTGEVVGQIRGEPEEWLDTWGGAVHSRHLDGTLTVTLRDSGVELWRVDAPENYGINEGVLSPDGAWVAMVDRSERLLLVPADGSVAPRVWAEVEESWVRPVWEGSDVPTPEER